MVKPWVTSTRVPGPRQPFTIAWSSRRRTLGSPRSGRSATDFSTGPTAISSAVSTQRQTGDARTRSTRTPRCRKAAPSACAWWRVGVTNQRDVASRDERAPRLLNVFGGRSARADQREDEEQRRQAEWLIHISPDDAHLADVGAVGNRAA